MVFLKVYYPTPRIPSCKSGWYYIDFFFDKVILDLVPCQIISIRKLRRLKNTHCSNWSHTMHIYHRKQYYYVGITSGGRAAGNPIAAFPPSQTFISSILYFLYRIWCRCFRTKNILNFLIVRNGIKLDNIVSAVANFGGHIASSNYKYPDDNKSCIKYKTNIETFTDKTDEILWNRPYFEML